jgi:putative sigma-54 modulation protein
MNGLFRDKSQGEDAMVTQITSRHFKAHDTLNEYAENAVEQLTRYFDGIIRADMTFSFEKSRKSTKIAELRLSVHGSVLVGLGKTDDFFKSVDEAVAKVLVQLKKYKSKLKEKDRTRVRSVHGKVTA